MGELKIGLNMAKSKFRGCLLGVLLGDCLGGQFEGDSFFGSNKQMTQNYFDLLDSDAKVPYSNYSDEYGMTKALTKALIGKQPVDYELVAKSLVDEYFESPTRGYTESLMKVLFKLRSSNYKNIYEPAKEIKRSYGSGGAIRVSAISLCYHHDYQRMIEICDKQTRITHSHLSGVNGSLLQCIAVHQGFITPYSESISVVDFGKQLIEKMKEFEKDVQDSDAVYTKQLSKMMDILLGKYEDQYHQDLDVVKYLGTSMDGVFSVPTAIYCFLRSQSYIDKVKADNVMRRAIQYAVSFGGEASTIGSLTGAIVGAYSGESAFTPNIRKHLEYANEAIELSDKLFSTWEKILKT